jgi:predicted glycoside hydrolase/deacetylase ChbG (UPF0249 family)
LSRHLVVTADDVGLHPGMTQGALEAHERGIVTACSVAAGGPDFPRAVELLRDRPSLTVGVHLVLVGGRPLSLAVEVRSLVTRDGVFLPGFRAFLRRYYAGRIHLDEVERELRRQIEGLLGAGLAVRHANGHQHLHVLPRVHEVVLRLAEEYGIGFVRTPIDRRPRRVPLPRRLAVLGLACLARGAHRRAQHHPRVRAGDGTIGIAEAGHLTVGRITELLPLVEGLTELVCHPGIDERAIAAEFPWGYEWETETRTLCDPALRGAVREAGITLVSPAELAIS